MIIFKITNVTKQQVENGLTYNAKLDKKGRLIQNEFIRIANNLLEGIPTFLKGVQIKSTKTPMPKFAYSSVNVSRFEQLPKELQEQKGPNFQQAIKDYNARIIQTVNDYIERRAKYVQNLDVRNEFYKDIMNVAMSLHITAYSPCAKTYFEVKASRDFMDSIPEDRDITDEQIAYVECNARKYGLDIPTTDFYIASRQATRNIYDEYNNFIGTQNHGTTEEIYRVYATRENFFESHFGVAEKKNYTQAFHPNNVPEEWMVQSMGTTRGQYREVYEKIKYFESLDPETRDFFIADGYCRCPHCGEITRKVNNQNIDIRCEYCDEILEELICVSNDHILYGTDIDNSYSDLDDVQSYIDDYQQSDDAYEGDEYDE